MTKNSKARDITILLADYMNIVPSGPQEAYVPLNSGGNESSWPLTAESVLRMGNNDVADTYRLLDKALVWLDRKYPKHYAAIVRLYMHDGAGHRDVDFLRNKAMQTGNPAIVDLLERHDEAIALLSGVLKNHELWGVRYPQKAPGPKPMQNMQEKHDELFAIFLRYMEQDELPYRQSIKNAAFKMTDHEGNPYYSTRHAERIIKPKWIAHNEA